MSANKSERSYMQTVSVGFRKWESMHVCEASRRNSDRSCKNSVMHATVVRCEWKLKRYFYKLTYIKMTVGAHWNQADNTHTKRNTKSDRNTTRDMKSELSLKHLSWMCRRLLDAIWDVKSIRSMWGMSSKASGLWVLIKSRLWRVCHKSRKVTLGGKFLKWSLH